MSILDAETKARTAFRMNPEKILSKLDYGYCQRKALVPYEMSTAQFSEMLSDYQKKFPAGTTLDALWAFNSQCKLSSGVFSSRIPLALGQIAELEGRLEIAIRNYLECVVLMIVEDLESFETLSQCHKEWEGNPFLYLRRYGNVDYLSKGCLVGDRIAQIIKKAQATKQDVFNQYKYLGAIPRCRLTTEQINNFIAESIGE